MTMDLLSELAILVLAAFVGLEVISPVPNTSVESSIVDLVVAIAFGTINVIGDFLCSPPDHRSDRGA